MIAVIHPDDDSEKPGNFGHMGKLGHFCRTFNFFRRSVSCHMEWSAQRVTEL
jgi:hypothetical protein